MISQKHKFKKDAINLFKCNSMQEIEKDVEIIFKSNSKILPKNKNAKILIKPNFNNDLNALTGNSTDLRLIISVIKSLKKRKYKNITLADGPNCGINHIGIDVFKRLGLDKIAQIYKIKLINLNNTKPKKVKLTTNNALISHICLESDFIINLPKLKTHVEAGITIACKNYIGCFLGEEKRKIHDNLIPNIIRLNEIIKTDLIIVDALICMEGNGPGDGITKKLGYLISGHDPYLLDFTCSKLMGLNYKKIPFLKIAIKKNYISQQDINQIQKINPLAKFIPAKKTFFGRILLNNFFIGIRFNKSFQRFFNKGFIPWFLFKLGVRQDIYIHEEKNIEKLDAKSNLTKLEKQKITECMQVYCPLKLKTPSDKKCIQCMYCHQILPNLIKYKGNLGAFQMQLDRFGKFVREN